MSETLEAMARALFKSWFVDFDPVRAKAEGRDPGLPQPLADLFPARLVDSELGEIPEGWEVKPLADVRAMSTRGLSSKGSRPFRMLASRMHNLNSIYEGGGYKHDGIKRYEGEYKSHHVAQAGDLIVANTEQDTIGCRSDMQRLCLGRFCQASHLQPSHLPCPAEQDVSTYERLCCCHLLNTRRHARAS